jgi:ubiquinone/menaquinone biosynthesis C-methylase UbiE
MQEANLNWPIWFHRWEMMQNSYISHRGERFDLMLRLPGWPRDQALRILDLGCGPGSVALCAARHFPQAHIVAVDADPILLTMGQAIALQRKAPIQFLQADLREPGWLEASGGEFDLALSATALHWLSQDHLRALYGWVYTALKPGGWFINADHFASDQPETQAHYRALTQERQRLARLNAHADDWAGYWRSLRLALGSSPAEPPDGEGTDDGYPKAFHFQALRASGFESVDIHWQDLGDAILAAQKPAGGAG